MSSSSLPSGWGITLLPGDTLSPIDSEAVSGTHVGSGSLQCNTLKSSSITSTDTDATPDIAAINPGQLESTLAIQEYIQMAIKYHRSNMDILTTLPSGSEQNIWIYEHLRQIIIELNFFLVRLSDECDSTTCPEMKATDSWVFLCAGHGSKQAPKKCCAIEYCAHTLSSFMNVLNSTDMFPNRYTIPQKSAQQFPDIFRRVYRIFAHAFYHHKQLFQQEEKRSHLCHRFLNLATKFSMMDQKTMIPAIQLS